MPPAPRLVYAKKSASESTRIHTPGRKVPIIIVPDFMGTRLTDTETGDLVWNPKGSPFGSDPGSFKVDVDALSDVGAELDPDETHRFPSMLENEKLPKIKHVEAMLLDVYKTMAEKLSSEQGNDEAKLGLERVLYFCGYDWRQDNARSAQRLAEMVEEALDDTGENKVILVGHGMGGMICRYYCRALGGESRVHQLFLVGSPVLGTPSAFAALKHGLDAIYPRDIEVAIMTGDTGALVFECASNLASVVSAVTAATPGQGMESLVGNLYLLLCLAHGKWMSRDETRTLVRQMPSVYQMMPGAVFSNANRHWMIFDPLATGVAATGFMVPMPTLADQTTAAMDAMSGSAHLGSALRSLVSSTAEAEDFKPSGRASRNAMTFIDMVGKIGIITGELIASGTNFPFEDREAELMDLLAACEGFVKQAKRTFVDCRNPKSVYQDPYTGLLDAVDERPLCAAMLSYHYHFDDAVTVNPREEKAMSLLDALMAAFKPLLNALGAAIGPRLRNLFFDFATLFDGAKGDGVNEKWREQSNAAAADATDETAFEKRRKARLTPKAYIPPETYSIYADSQPTLPGCAITPSEFVSNDDSNEVKSNYLGAPTGVGDGTVLSSSASPATSLLFRALAGSTAVSGVRHQGLPGAPDTTTFIKTTINSKIKEFCKT